MENIYTTYDFSHHAIYLPKLIKVGWNLTKFWHKFFERQYTLDGVCINMKLKKRNIKHGTVLKSFEIVSSNTQWRRYGVARQCKCTASLMQCTATCTASVVETYYPYNWHCTNWIRQTVFNWEHCRFEVCIGAFIPGSDRFLDIDVLLPLAEQYKSNVDDLKVEVQQIQRMIQRKEADFDKENKLLAFAVFIKQYRDAY